MRFDTLLVKLREIETGDLVLSGYHTRDGSTLTVHAPEPKRDDRVFGSDEYGRHAADTVFLNSGSRTSARIGMTAVSIRKALQYIENVYKEAGRSRRNG